MTFTEWLQVYVPIILGVLSIISIVVGFVYKATKSFEKFIKTEVQEVAKELKPNGGSSLRDQVNKLEKSHNILDKKVDSIIDHLINPNK